MIFFSKTPSPKFDPKKIQYSAKHMEQMTDEELRECKSLYDSNYGRYRKDSAVRPGEQVKFPEKRYREDYCNPNFYIATARLAGKLIGHAIYFRKDYTDRGFGKMTWVAQLVVDNAYRRNGVASTLLRSIWGFSDDYAWGLATTNPCTVKTLESATFRKCKPDIIQKNLKAINAIRADIFFAGKAKLEVSGTRSQINSDFWVDNSSFVKKDDSCEKQLGKLKPGYEWLAFTFRNQDIQKESYKKQFPQMVSFSERKLKEAYSRMDMSRHKWAAGTVNEIDFIMQYGRFSTALDMGCGTGRHAIELAKRGLQVTGVDFSEKHIWQAQKDLADCGGEQLNCRFYCDDVRCYTSEMQYDVVICLYDVIGSFPEKEDNLKIIKNAYNHLQSGGIFIASVMNMELTDKIVPDKNKGDLQGYPDIIRKLPPSSIMQSSGNVFKPEFIAIDKATGLVYRKEQFSEDDGLSAEYIIRDKRYTMPEISDMLSQCGFEIDDARYVRAGHFDEPLKSTDAHAKEICVVARKK